MIETVAETGSTNADLLARVAQGETLSEGFWLRADRQVGGRGRSGRQWLSPEGNLYASTVVNLGPDELPPQTLSLAIGLAVHDHICGALNTASHRHVVLKWPNDVLVRRAKVAGILLERSGEVIVVGIGINIASAPVISGRETACIRDLNMKNDASPDYSLQFLAPRVAEQLARWRSDGLAQLVKRWSAAALPKGTPLSVHDGNGEVQKGTFDGLEPNGALRLCLPDGTMRAIHAGDVMLED